MVNLSSRGLTQIEFSVLNKGLKFVPTPRYVDVAAITQPVKEFTRKLMITKFFHLKNKSIKVPFVGKSEWCPPPTTIPQSIRQITDGIFKQISRWKFEQEKPNLTQAQLAAITTLQQDKDIVIRKADKGSAAVILDTDDYIEEINQQLSNTKHYRQIQHPIYPETGKKITTIVHRLMKNRFINKKQAAYLTPPENPRPRHMYTLPKIHKEPATWYKPFKVPQGRPIISDVGSESYLVSEYIDSFLAPLATKHPAYLRDTNDFLDKIRHIKIPQNSLLVTLDVESMYTNIDNKDGLQAVLNCFRSNPDPKRPDLEILELLKLSLVNNDFEFNGKWYLQISGTAMGKKFAPSYANIFMAEWEKEVFKRCNYLPLVYLRFLDDIFLIWPYSRKKFDTFLSILNSYHPSVKLKACVMDTSVDFLDTTIFKGPEFVHTGKLDSKVYFKPTDTHQLLHKSSFHPRHTFKGIIKSQIIRFHRLCTRKEDFQRATITLFRTLRDRGYSKRFLRKIKNITLNELNGGNMHTLGKARSCQGRRCATCPFVRESNSFTSHTNNQTFLIKHNLSCDSNNIIYLITCDACGKQYVGQTTLTLRDRFTRHRFDIIHKENKSISNHFNSEGHSLDDCSILPIEMVVNKENLTKREAYWIKKLGTISPFGLNLHEEVIDLIPFVITYNTKATLAAKLIREGFVRIQKDFPHIYNQTLITAYRKNKNLGDILIRNKIRR